MKYLSQRIATGFFFMLVCVTEMYAQSGSALQALIRRRFPALENKVSIRIISSVDKDSASYRTQNGKLYIDANTINAASYALYDYVKKYCHSSLSHTGDNIQIPNSLPETKQQETVSADLPLRYALNYCTYNYTMSFWTWQQWEKELDLMSLSGVNLMLAPIGTEEVWQNTLRQLNFSDKEIREFIPGPAFDAWWLMGNLQGWGGPISDKMIMSRTDLQKKILARMNELHIQPVIQGFTGIVPSIFGKHFPDAKIIAQGFWCGFERPSVLAAKDPLFKKAAELYYVNFKKLYGNNFKYIGGDLFHEGGKTDGIDLAEEGRTVQQNMEEYFPGAVWVLQGWQDNPKAAMMKGLDIKHTLIIDLLGDRTDTWLQRNQYENFPWIWSTVSNFGARTTTGGTLLRVLTEPKRAERVFGKSSSLKGTGIIPEGIENNAIIYQWALDAAWMKTLPSVQQLLNEFIVARYGINDPNVNNAWQYLLQTIYNGREPGVQQGQGGYESVFCARPDTNEIYSASSWGPQKLWFDPELLRQAALCFTKAVPQLHNSETFQYDLTDTWRQVIDLEAWQVYASIRQSVKRNDKASFDKYKDLFIKLLLLQDNWLGTNKNFMTGKWLGEAINLLPDSTDKKLCELNARIQITYWGPDNRNTELHEYAYKEWNGILKDLYLKRWNAYFDYTDKKMSGEQPVYPDFFSMEKDWTTQRNSYAATPADDWKLLLPQLVKLISPPYDKSEQSFDFFNDK